MRLILAIGLLLPFALIAPAAAAVSDGKEFLTQRAYAGAIEPRRKVQRKARAVKRQGRAAVVTANIFDTYSEKIGRGSVSLAGVVPELAAFARTIAADCGSRVISALRNTYVAGTRTKSLHAEGRAVDMAGNPSCIRKHLANWGGGASTDYGRVAHYHISWGGREHGRRFVHGMSRKAKRTRYARAG